MLAEDKTGWYSGGLHVAALAGGVGGAKLASGLAGVLPPDQLTIIVNTGDDFTHLGLRISPDLDTVCYTLAGLANPDTGWGRAGESWQMMENLTRLGGPEWFNLSDQDLATHLERTRRLSCGETLSEITRDFCRRWDMPVSVLPMTDDPVATWVETEAQGWLAFQEYFVGEQCKPKVKGFRFAGADQAKAAPGVVAAMEAADLIVICPSNPWVSIGPILAITEVQEVVRRKRLAIVSPIVGGKAIKGPAAKMYQELGIVPSALSVAQHYQSLLSIDAPNNNASNRETIRNVIVIDTIDSDHMPAIKDTGMDVLVTGTIMATIEDRRRLAGEVLRYCIPTGGRNIGL